LYEMLQKIFSKQKSVAENTKNNPEKRMNVSGIVS
jgi:hypothetical protein